MRTHSPPNEPRRPNIGATPGPLHLALSLIKGENADIRSVRRHPSDPYQHRQICIGALLLYRLYIGAKAPMGLSLPCGKARNQANEGWPLPARCGNRQDWAEMETGPVCRWQRRRGGGKCYRQRGTGRRAACWLGASLSFDMRRRPGKGVFRSLR